MKKITKRIMAFMLSLVMVFGCVPSFINEANANENYEYRVNFDIQHSTPEVDAFTPDEANELSFDENNVASTLYQIEEPYHDRYVTHYSESLNCHKTVEENVYYFEIVNDFRDDGNNTAPYEELFMNDIRNNVLKIYVNNRDITKFYSEEFNLEALKTDGAQWCYKPGKTWNYFKIYYLYDFNVLYVDYTKPTEPEDLPFKIDGRFFSQEIQDSRDVRHAIPNDIQYRSINGRDYAVTVAYYGFDDDYNAVKKIKFRDTVYDISDTDYVKELANDPSDDEFIASRDFAIIKYNKNFVLYEKVDIVPKTPITSLSLGGTGSLEGGKASGDQTLKWTEPDGAHFTSDDAEGSTWYKNNTCSSGDEVTTFRASETYYKKVTLTPASGYEFDTDKIKTISVTNGTFDSFISKSKSKIEAVISAKATGITVTLNYTKPNSYKSFKDITIPDYTVTGATSAGIVGKGQISDITSDNTDKGTYYLFTSLNFNSDDEVNSVEKILFRGTNIYVDSNRTPSTTNLDKMSLMKTHNVVWYIGTHQIVIIEKFDYRRTENITFTAASGMTTADVLASVNLSSGELGESGISLESEFSLLDPTDTLEAGKKYRIYFTVDTPSEEELYTEVKVNNSTLTFDAELDQSKDGWNKYTPSLIINYTFECKQQSSGGHKKKKTEEPKQEEPQKTLEEKLQDELKKDDVKKANSNEGEKINPSAKYINGYDDGSFKPNNKVNNIELMSMVTELFDNVEIKETKDLNQGKDYWGQEIIDKANALGLIPGNKDNKNYNLSDEVTRGDLAVVVYNLVKDYTDAPSLKDRNNCKDAIGKNYEKEAAKLLELGIFKGYDDGMFHGDYTLTRAEAVVVINRALKSLGFEINMPSIKLSFPDLSKEHWAYAEIMYAANK